jgi:hypothetical protein
LEQLVKRDTQYDKAMTKAIKEMENAPALGFSKIASRSELHER